MKNKIILIILDGFGVAPPWGGNAVSVAIMPNWKNWTARYPHTNLAAYGKAVGLPVNEIGNSEVGHLTIGAGRVIPQDSTLINQAIIDGSFYKNKALLQAFDIAKNNNLPLHLMGLLSDGGVHASFNHLEALIKLAKVRRQSKVFLHLFMDGRDTLPEHGIELVEKLKALLKSSQVGQIATITGRFYAMDRDHRQDRTIKTVNCLTNGVGDFSNSVTKVVANAYQNKLSDEFIPPTVIVDTNRQPVGLIKNNEPIIFFNFRSDRARQISNLLNQNCPNSLLVSFIPYGVEGNINTAKKIISAFFTQTIKNNLPDFLEVNKIPQLHIAETEKYAHVTYFFNSGIEESYPLEQRIMILSPKVKSYDTTPAMSANEITKVTIDQLKAKKQGFIVVNFANADMVGHTGNLAATVKSLEILDQLLEKIISVANSNNYISIITSDHGNAEQMIDPSNGSVDTEHTRNPVPLTIISELYKSVKLKAGGSLADIAPTILEMIGLQKPVEMTGQSLIN